MVLVFINQWLGAALQNVHIPVHLHTRPDLIQTHVQSAINIEFAVFERSTYQYMAWHHENESLAKWQKIRK